MIMNLKPFTKRQIESFNDENKFVEEMVIPLFEKIAEYRGYFGNGPVKIENWGKDKRNEGSTGIDVYFGFYDEFNKENHYGAQAKISKIVCESQANISNSIEIIANQIRKAYKSSFTNPLNPQEQAKISGFYIITSKKANSTARDYFKSLGYPNVELLDIDDLVYAIKKLSDIKHG
jgi:hypothetical protein